MTPPATPLAGANVPDPSGPSADPHSIVLGRVIESLTQLADDTSLPRNARKAAQSAKDELARPGAPQDVRIASAVGVLDDLANNPNLPSDGRTAIWSIMSHLESVQ